MPGPGHGIPGYPPTPNNGARLGPKRPTFVPWAQIEPGQAPDGFAIDPNVFRAWAGFSNAIGNGLPHGVNRAALALSRFPQAVK